MRLSLKNGNLQNILAGKNTRPPTPYVGFIIRRLRELQGLSQCSLAQLADANLSYVNTVEGGLNNISISKVRLLCNALQLQLSVIVTILHNMEISAALSEPDQIPSAGI
ncbi:MAG TPA: hypothetical protein DD640_04035 [Clostridiales bacterium]|nr:hypothetical protein [Clostridiales bacterium]